jgi:hypothetical protein
MESSPIRNESDLVARLDANASAFAEVIGSFPPEALLEPFGDEFSATEHACHLRDLERDGFTPRIRSIIEEDDPVLYGFDGTGVAAASDYRSQHAGDAVSAFVEARRRNVERLRGLREGDFLREGHYEGEAPITLGSVLAGMVDHDSDHLDRLRTMRLRAG